MKNFEKNLEEASQEELYRWVNTLDSRLVTPASDELTRRSLKDLKEVIQAADKTATRHSKIMVGFTLVLFIIAMMQLAVAIFSLEFNVYVRTITFIVSALIVGWIFRKLEKDPL